VRLILLLLMLLPLKHKGYRFNRSEIERMKRKRNATIRNKPKENPDDVFEDEFGDDDPFAGTYQPEEESDEERRQRQYEERLIRQMEKAERSRLYAVIMEQGGIQTRDDLREEYREIPNNFKRRDGMPGDEMADYLKTYYAEFGIETENDLLDYFAA
jgi:hypothetical protein